MLQHLWSTPWQKAWPIKQMAVYRYGWRMAVREQNRREGNYQVQFWEAQCRLSGASKAHYSLLFGEINYGKVLSEYHSPSLFPCCCIDTTARGLQCRIFPFNIINNASIFNKNNYYQTIITLEQCACRCWDIEYSMKINLSRDLECHFISWATVLCVPLFISTWSGRPSKRKKKWHQISRRR